MFAYISAFLAIAAIFAAILIQLTAGQKFSARLTGAALVIAGIGGLLFYGFGYTYLGLAAPVAILRGVLSVISMFLGGIDNEIISGTPLSANVWIEAAFWFVHLAALYATASATIAAIGDEAMKKLRLWLIRRQNLSIIYGVNPDSVSFGTVLMEQTRDAVVFVDPNPDPSCIEAVSRSGCLLRTDKDAAAANLAFAKSVGIRGENRRVSLYCLDYDGVKNLRYGTALRDTLEQRGVSAQRASLTILGVSDSGASRLQLSGDRYGYGFVTVFQQADLVSRLLIREYPPCDTVSFDETGTAREDFEALVVGFGQLGQAVLRALVMNGQFVGSNFRCTVFDPRFDRVNGFLYSTCSALMGTYDIRMEPYDGRSEQLFSHLAEHASTVKYIVLCTNSAHINQEIASEMLRFFERLGRDIPIYQCSHRGVVRSTNSTLLSDEHSIYTPDLLRYDRIDRHAMGINQTYQYGTTKTALENWMECDYFSRMSSRASADFFPAILRAAGTSEEALGTQPWPPQGQLLENLGKMEHLRWNAFHFCMGYSPMTQEEYDRRAAGYLEDKAAGLPPRRIGKNTAARTHACLVDWEELDALSARENAITGGNVDYKLMDIRNVEAIPQILSQEA